MALVCHCEVVREAAIVAAIDDGARSIADVQQACGAALRCGGCRPTVEALLRVHRPDLISSRA